jgi:hypothetical protein
VMNARSLSPRSWLMNSHTPSLRRLAACLFAVSPAPTFQPRRIVVSIYRPTPNPAVDPVPFGHWTLRDEAAQRRSLLLQGLPHT